MALLVDVHNKPEDLFQTVKQRIEACRAKCKCEKERKDPDALPYQKLERMGARGRELPSYERREIAAGGSSEYGWQFCYEDFWFGDDTFGAFNCGCDKYPGNPPDRVNRGQYRADGSNDCGAPWFDQLTGYTFLDVDGLTGDEKFVGYGEQAIMRNGYNFTHYHCSEAISNGSAGYGGPQTSASGPGRDHGFGPGALHLQPSQYSKGSGCTIGYYSDERSRITDTMIWHNYIATRKQASAWYSTFGSREMTGKYIGHKELEKSPASVDNGFVEWLGSYYLYSAEEYIGRTCRKVDSVMGGPVQYYVFTGSGRDKDGRYSPTEKRVFTIGDKVRLGIDSFMGPGPEGSLSEEWVGTITSLSYGTFNFDLCIDKLCNGICGEAYLMDEVPGPGCPDIGDPPNCSRYSADEWVGNHAFPDTRSTPDELLPPSEWPIVSEGDGWMNESCNPNVITITGFRYIVTYPPEVGSRTEGFASSFGGMMYHAFPSGASGNLPAHKVRWDWPVNNSLDQWICKDGTGSGRPFASSLIENMNHWQSEPGGMQFWGGTGGKAYFTLEDIAFRYTTNATNTQPEWHGTSGFENYSPNKPYFHISNQYAFPQTSSVVDGDYIHKGPFVQVEGTRDSNNWDRKRCGAPDVYVQLRFYEFDMESGKISNVTGTHQEIVECNCEMSYSQIDWYKLTGDAAPSWWPWKKAWMAGYEVDWKCNESNTKAYAKSGGPEGTAYYRGEWPPVKIYSWPVDANLLREGNYEAFANACKLENAPEGAINIVEVPGDETTYPYDLAWNAERPWRTPDKWGYWYWGNYWIPPK